MPQYDFSSGFNLLNQGINSLGEALGNRSDAEAYAGINDSLSQGTAAGYQQAMAKAMAAGKPDLALKIQGIALQYGQAGAAAAGFGGGGGGAPAVPGDTTAATLKPPAAPGTEVTPKPLIAPEVQTGIDTATKQVAGVDPTYLRATAMIENSGRPNNPFQFQPGTAARFKVDPNDPTSSALGAANYAVENRTQLAQALGRPPTWQETYLAHQQGAGGAAKLLTNPGARAGDLVGDAAVTGNGGDPNMSAAEFVAKQEQRYNTALQQVGGGGGPAATRAASDPAVTNFLATTSAHPTRPGDTSNLNPAFATPLASAIAEARSQGLNVGVQSGFREAGQTGSAYDAGGNSSHTYGLASDISGLDGPNGPKTKLWAQIAAKYGLSNPYGIGDPQEFNHWQLPPKPLEQTPDLLKALKSAKSSGDITNVWNAYRSGAQTPAAAPQPPGPPRPGAVPPNTAGLALNAPEGGVDAVARWLATHLPGAPTPQQQAAAAANPPGIGGFSLGSLLGAKPPQGAPPAQGPGQNIPAAYGQPPAPTPEQAPMPPVRPADLGPQPPQPPAPTPPAPPAAPQPPADTAAAFADRARRRQAFIDTESAGGPPRPPDVAKDVPPQHTPAPVPPALQPKSAANAPVEPPRIPVDYGRPPAPDQPPPAPTRPPPPTRPAALAPRGPAQGPYGPPGGPGSAFARDFGPGAGQMWGPQGGVMAAPGGVGPSQGPVPPGQPSILGPNASPYAQAALAAIMAGRRPGAPGAGGMPPLPGGPGGPAPGPGAAPAALPPGAPPGAPAAGGGLGARLGGIGSGLINLLSLQPPGGIPGMPTAASYAQGRPTPPGGWGAPVPGGGGLPTAPAGLPAGAPGAGGAPAARPALIGDPAATPDQASRQAQTYAQNGTGALQDRALAMRQQQAWYGSLGNTGAAKAYGDEADKLEARIAEQEKQSSAAGYETGKIGTQAQAEMAKEDYKNLSTGAADIRRPGGATGIIKTINTMKQDLEGAPVGYGPMQGMVEHVIGALAPFDVGAGKSAATLQELQGLRIQEMSMLASQLFQKLNRNEFKALQDGNYNFSDRPEAIRALLDVADERARAVIQAHNNNVDQYNVRHPGMYKPEQLEGFKIGDKEAPPPYQSPPPAAPKPVSKGDAASNTPGLTAANPIKVAHPRDVANLPVGTFIEVPGKGITTVTPELKARGAQPQ